MRLIAVPTEENGADRPGCKDVNPQKNVDLFILAGVLNSLYLEPAPTNSAGANEQVQKLDP
jgi:hypothetical protein